jgi:hypothetical protein
LRRSQTGYRAFSGAVRAADVMPGAASGCLLKKFRVFRSPAADFVRVRTYPSLSARWHAPAMTAQFFAKIRAYRRNGECIVLLIAGLPASGA